MGKAALTKMVDTCKNGIPSACIQSSAAAIGGVLALSALSAHFSAESKEKSRYNGALWGLATGLGSGSLMLYLRGRRHVIPCHWPCVAGFIPPAALGWWATEIEESEEDAAVASGGRMVNFMSQFVTLTALGLTTVFWLSPEDGRI